MLIKAKVERKLKWNGRSLTERAAEVVVDNLDKVLKSNMDMVSVDNMGKEISVETPAKEVLVETVAKEEDVLSQLELPKTLLPLLRDKLWRRDHFFF